MSSQELDKNLYEKYLHFNEKKRLETNLIFFLHYDFKEDHNWVISFQCSKQQNITDWLQKDWVWSIFCLNSWVIILIHIKFQSAWLNKIAKNLISASAQIWT